MVTTWAVTVLAKVSGVAVEPALSAAAEGAPATNTAPKVAAATARLPSRRLESFMPITVCRNAPQCREKTCCLPCPGGRRAVELRRAPNTAPGTARTTAGSRALEPRPESARRGRVRRSRSVLPRRAIAAPAPGSTGDTVRSAVGVVERGHQIADRAVVAQRAERVTESFGDEDRPDGRRRRARPSPPRRTSAIPPEGRRRRRARRRPGSRRTSPDRAARRRSARHAPRRASTPSGWPGRCRTAARSLRRAGRRGTTP